MKKKNKKYSLFAKIFDPKMFVLDFARLTAWPVLFFYRMKILFENGKEGMVDLLSKEVFAQITKREDAERALDGIKDWHYVIENEGSYDELVLKAHDLIEKIKLYFSL